MKGEHVMIMGVGLIMMGVGTFFFVVGLIVLLITAFSAPGRKKKMEEYLKEHY